MGKQDQVPRCPIQAVTLVLHCSYNTMSEVLIAPGSAKRAVVPHHLETGILNYFCNVIQVHRYCPSHPSCPAGPGRQCG